MTILFSRQCEYAMQAIMFMALKNDGELTSIKELTRRLNTPYHFLGKILQDLAHRGLLVSQKGPAGGFALAKPARDITLYQIVEAIDGGGLTNRCLLGFSECNGRSPCALHERWAAIRENIVSMMTHKNIAQTAREMRKPEYRIGSE